MSILPKTVACVVLGLMLFSSSRLPQINQEPDDLQRLSPELRAAMHDSQPVRRQLDLTDGRDAFPIRRQLDGKWQMMWDDVVDEKLDSVDKTCTIEFQEVGDVVTGTFIGPVAGRQRDAVLFGRLAGEGAGRLLTFQQREEGYVCSYQAFDAGAEIRGIWHDTQNRSGTFRLLRWQ